jgi:Dehydrogenases with different specificities (related to short-chain alcohol dehydrogenases)
MLKDKTAVITGSTSGIGLGIAAALAAEGSRVTLNGFGDRAEIKGIRKNLAECYGVQAAYSAADMVRPSDIRQMIADADRVLGPVDILVNNAGIQHVAPVERCPDEIWNATLSPRLRNSSGKLMANDRKLMTVKAEK